MPAGAFTNSDENEWRGTMYAINSCYYLDRSWNPIRLKIVNCPRPSDYMLCTDKAKNKGIQKTYKGGDGIVSYRHGGFNNIVFLDNHIESLNILTMGGTTGARPYLMPESGSKNYDK